MEAHTVSYFSSYSLSKFGRMVCHSVASS